MAIKVVSISQLLDKDLFASAGEPINIRSNPSAKGTILAKIKAGDRIGKVSTWVEGKDATGNKDGSIWLQLYEKYGNPSGFGGWVKYMPDAFDWKMLKQQGAMTQEEEIKEKQDKNKTLMDDIKEAGKWILLAWVAGKALEK